MTVTVNTLGSNSRQIVITGETSATNIINAVNTSLTALGWTLYDSVSSGSRGLLTTRVYSAPNNDGPSPTTKYMIIRYDLQRQYWFTSCCEAWNTGTKVATNESWYGGRHIVLPLQYSNCILYVFANARYAAFMGVVRDEPSPWQGVFEFEREATEDIAAKSVPNYGWTSSLTIGEPYGNITNGETNTTTSSTNGFVACGFAPPRTANSLTGLAAGNNFVLLTGLGEFPPAKSIVTSDWSTGGITQTLNSHTGMIGGFNENNSNYVWNTTKTVISNIKLAGYTTGYITGKIYGIKISVKLGAALDTTNVPVDANLFFSASGTNTPHALLNINGGYKDTLIVGTNRLVANAYASGTSLGTTNYSVVVSGRWVYIATTTGFHKFDLINLTFVFNVLPAGAFQMIRFDGENSLYVSTGTTTVYKLSLTDDSYTTYTAGAASTLIALDDTYLYVVTNASATTATVKRVTLSTFTESASWTITIGGAAQTPTHITTADYGGYVYVTGLTAVARANGRIVRILATDGSNSALTPPAATATTIASCFQPVFFDGENLWFTTGANASSANNLTNDKVRISDFTLLNSSVFGAATTTPAANIYGGSTVIGCEPASFGGMQIYFLGGSTYACKVSFSDPRVPTSTWYTSGTNNFPIASTNTRIDSTNINLSGCISSDGCSLYTLSSTGLVRYTGAYRNYNFNGVQTSNILIPQ